MNKISNFNFSENLEYKKKSIENSSCYKKNVRHRGKNDQ